MVLIDFFDFFKKILIDHIFRYDWLRIGQLTDFVKLIDFHDEVDERLRSLKSLSRNAGNVSQFRSL
jgi:hypothetical protein